MTYFDLFEIPFSFQIDLVALRAKYIALQLETHPDLTKHKEDKSLDINNGYKVLKDIYLRYQYVITNVGVTSQPTPSSSFLMETMDLNEEIEDSKSNEDLKTNLNVRIQTKIDQTLDETILISKDCPLNDPLNHIINTISENLMKLNYYKRMKKLLNNEFEM